MDDYDFDNEFDVDDFDGPSKKTVTKPKAEKDSDPYFKRKQSFGEKDKKDNGFEPFDEIEDWDDPETTSKPKPKKEEPKKKELPKPIEKDIDFKPRQSQNKVVVQKRKESEEFVDDFEEEIETPKPKTQTKPDIKAQPKVEPKYEPKKEISSPLKNDYEDDEDFEKEPEVSPVKQKQQIAVEDQTKRNKVNNTPPVQHKKEETYSDEELEDEDDYKVVETKPKPVQQKSPVLEKPIPQQVRAEMQT